MKQKKKCTRGTEIIFAMSSSSQAIQSKHKRNIELFEHKTHIPGRAQAVVHQKKNVKL